MRDVVGGEAAEVQGYRLEPVGPWRVKLAPYPFGSSPAHFSLAPTGRAEGWLRRRPRRGAQETAITIE